MDWDLREESTKAYYPHNICWYPSRFLPQIPAQFISALSAKGDVVYDPFCGCGTSLVESLKLGRNAIMTDISPVGIFLTTVKARIVVNEYVDVACLQELHDTLVSNNTRLFRALPRPLNHQKAYSYFQNNLAELKKWYHSSTLEDLISIKDAIEGLDAGLTADIAKAVFIAVLMPASGLPIGKPYTYYADNVKPKSALLQKDAFGLFRSRLARVIAGQSTMQCSSSSLHWSCKTTNVFNLNPTNIGIVDLIITSPPYLGVTDYVTGFRLAHLWYNFDCDINTLKHEEIGARWKRKRPNGLIEYLNDMDRSMHFMSNCLRPSGHICLVLGEAKKYSDTILDKVVKCATGILGLKVVSSFQRNINQNFFINQNGGVATETIFVFRK